MRPKRRYSGTDKHFGPFTLSRHNNGAWRPLGVMLNSGGDHESSESKGCHLMLQAFGYTLIVELPNFLRDYQARHKSDLRPGEFWTETFPCEYGFRFSDDAVHLHYGPQTHDSTTDKNKVLWLPWKQWRFIRQSWYGPTGEHVETLWETSSKEVRAAQWEWRREFEASLSKVVFEFDDYDGERIRASTHIEEREWHFGTGLFRWLSLFRRPRIRRSLDIEFSSEVGPEKGSWKGGLIGTGIDMLPGELHEQAFRRFCEAEHRSKYCGFKLAYVGRAQVL